MKSNLLQSAVRLVRKARPRALVCAAIGSLTCQSTLHAERYTVDTADDTSANDGLLSLREALANANANTGPDEIVFHPALAGQVINLGADGSLVVTDSVSISDQNDPRVTVNANGAFRVIEVLTSTGPVSLSGLALTGGGNSDKGGALYVNPGNTVVLDSVQLVANAAVDGGGLYNDGGTVTIVDSVLSDNVANGPSGSGGAAFNASGGKLSIQHTQILRNVANRAGGGIEDASGAGLGLTLVNVHLTGNNAGVAPASAAPGNGGGLHISGPGDVTITGGLSQNNVAAREGGALWNGGGLMTINGMNFSRNQASGPAADDGGGALFNNGGSLTIDGGWLADNSANGASGSGGALLTVDGEITINEVSFIRNVANRAGGAIEIIDGKLTLTDVILGGFDSADGNIAGPAESAAPGNGGGIHITNEAEVIVDGGFIGGNQAARDGGGLWNQYGSTMIVRNGAVLDSNEALGDNADQGGGGIFNHGGTLIINDATIWNNTASGAAGSGGGLFARAGEITINDTTISANVANRAGGGIEIIEGSLELTNCVLGGSSSLDANVAGPSGTAAPGNGGGLHVSGGSTINIRGGEVTGNQAAREGGGLWNQAGATMTISDGVVVNNNTASGAAADDGGGGIFNNGGVLTVVNAMISHNTADGASGSGGGLFNNTGGTMTITSSIIDSNVSNRAGGGIEDLAGAGITITDSQLTDNLTGPEGQAVPGNGGAVHISGAGNVTVQTTTVQGNYAAKEGGGLWNSGAGNMTVERSTVASNTAPSGGGLFSQAGNGHLRLTNSTISGNQATSGGGLRAEGGTIELLHVTAANNKATSEGGGLSNDGGALNLSNALIVNNTAPVGDNVIGVTISNTRSFIGSDPALSPLGDFGGPTQTHLPMEGSAALEAGDNLAAAGLLTDQRDFARIIVNVDLGAVEVQGVAPADGMVNSTGDTLNPLDGVTSLREAVILANTSADIDMIMLGEGTHTLTLSGADEDAAATGDLDITRSVTIIGTGTATIIDASGLNDRLFETFGAIEVRFANLTLVGGRADDGGGLMNRGAKVFLTEVHFSNNTATGASGSGGAIFNDAGGAVTIKNSTLDGNQANRAGGAIEDASGAGLGITLKKVIMTNNNAGVAPATAAPGNGGALHVTGPGAVSISEGHTSGNRAAREGGGLWNGTGDMFLSGHLIANNSAHGDAADDGGGGLFNNGGTLGISSTVFIDNKALGASGSGGGLFSTAGNVTMLGGSMINNVANRAGGGIEIIAGKLTANTVRFAANIAGPAGTAAPGNGGAVHISGAATTVINRGVITNNLAAREGGGLWNQAGATMTVMGGAQISSNTASGDAADDGGGGVFNNGGTLVLTEAQITNNMANGASGSGGGVFNQTGGVTNVTNTQITGNAANRAGGGIEDNSGAGLGLTLTNVRLDNNNAGVSPAIAAPGNGGGLHVTGPGDVTFTGGTANGNVAAREGGGLWNGGGSMRVTGVELDGNQAHGNAAPHGGGALFNLSGMLEVEQSTLSANVATGTSGSGGGILSLAGEVTIMSSTIERNVANRAGGGIEIVDGALTISGSALGGPLPEDGNVAGPTGTAAPGNGGGLHVTGSAAITIDQCNILHNVAAREGGGLWNQAGSTMTVTHSKVNRNRASGDAADDGGGGLFNNGGNTIVGMTEFTGNIADGASGSGGGLFNHTGGSLTITDSEIVSNRANRAGGGIEDNSGAGLGLLLENVTLDSNNAGLAPATAAPGNGGGLHITGPGDVTINGGTSDMNVAAREGGALWNGSGSMTVTMSEIRHNMASGPAADDGGGGIFNNGGTLTVDGAFLLGNIADGASGSGGGLLSTAGSVTLNDSAVSDNVANRAGGGVEVIDGALDLTNSILDGNLAGPTASAAPGNGGGVHVSGTAAVTISGGQVLNNIAAREGGGLWNQAGATMTIKDAAMIVQNASEGEAIHDGGGGVFNNGGSLVIDNALIEENAAVGFDAQGGGLQSVGGSVSLNNVTLADNFAFEASGISLIDATATAANTMIWNDVNVIGSSRLQGTPQILGALSASDGAVLAPGNGIGTLEVGDADLLTSAVFEVQLGAGATSDKLLANGFVALDGAVLNVLPLTEYVPRNTDMVVILANSGSQPIIGQFAGLPELATFDVDGTEFRITYQGGDGNDVVIMPAAGVGVGMLASIMGTEDEAIVQTVTLFNNGDTPWYVERLIIQGLPESVVAISADGQTDTGDAYFQSVRRLLKPGENIDVTVIFDGQVTGGFEPTYVTDFGTPPTPSSAFAITEIARLTGGDILIGFNSDPSAIYVVEWSSDLQNWDIASTVIEGEDGFTTWVDDGRDGDVSQDSTSHRFYRMLKVD